MKLFIFLLAGSLFAHGHDSYREVFDVTKGMIRRNWALTKEIDGVKIRTMWFTNKEACEAFKAVHYKEQKGECLIYDI